MKIQVIPVTPFAQNCSLIWDPDSLQGAVVDPGGDIDKITQAIDAHGVKVEKIILTHGHLDHVGATVVLADKLDAEVVGPHKDDEFWLQALPQQSQMFGFPPAQPFEPDTWLSHKDVIKVGKWTLEVLHCPGHTPGHVVLYEPSAGMLIAGDVIFKGSIGRTDFPRGDGPTLVKSIREQLFCLPNEVVIYPGHGPTTSIEHEKNTNPFVADSKFG